VNSDAFYVYCVYGILLVLFLFSLFKKGTKTLSHMQIKHRSFAVLNMAIDVQWNTKSKLFHCDLVYLRSPLCSLVSQKTVILILTTVRNLSLLNV